VRSLPVIAHAGHRPDESDDVLAVRTWLDGTEQNPAAFG
jgi:hypothetical protein